MKHGEPRWTGKVELIEEHLQDPLRWKKPRRIFVNSMSDLFHENLSDEQIDRVFGVMALCPQHTKQVLTKRGARMLSYVSDPATPKRIGKILEDRYGLGAFPDGITWPIRSVWLGVSVENREATYRIDELRKTPAAIRFLSLEPLLEDLGELNLEGIHWVIVGGESGPNARPAHPDWVRRIRDQCQTAGVPLFFKQRGKFTWDKPLSHGNKEWGTVDISGKYFPFTTPWNGRTGEFSDTNETYVYKVGKKKAGALLDGREWREFPI